MSPTLLLLGGIVTVVGAVAAAVVAIVKLGPERAGIEIQNVERLVAVEAGYSERLEKRLADLEASRDKQDKEIAWLHEQLEVVTGERDKLRNENRALKDRVADLEQRVEDLSSREGRQGARGTPGTQGVQGIQGVQGEQGRDR